MTTPKRRKWKKKEDNERKMTTVNRKKWKKNTYCEKKGMKEKWQQGTKSKGKIWLIEIIETDGMRE